MTPQPPWTHSDAAPARKPRRLGLYLPYAIAAFLVVAWSCVWLWLAGETQRRIDGAAATLRAAGWQVAWSERHIGGYPFRLDVDVANLRLADPSGWVVAMPLLKCEAHAFAPTRWLFAAADGLTFTRPGGGAVAVTGRPIRASVNSWDQHPPRISVEGDDLTFATASGAQPFPLTEAASVQFYTRAGPNDQAALLFLVQRGVAATPSRLGALADGRPVDITVDAILSHASALQGRDWRSLVADWARSGGAFDVRQFTLAAGGAGIDARSGRVSMATDGRLAGTLPATLTQPSRVRAALAGEPAPPPAPAEPPLTAPLTFKDGAAWIGRQRLGPAPRAF